MVRRYVVTVADHRAQAFEVHVLHSGWAESITRIDEPVQEDPALSSRQRTILRAIRELTERFGYPPSYRELGEEVGINASSVAYQIAELLASGHVQLEPGRPRTLKVRYP